MSSKERTNLLVDTLNDTKYIVVIGSGGKRSQAPPGQGHKGSSVPSTGSLIRDSAVRGWI
jgi:hypothetical protein